MSIKICKVCNKVYEGYKVSLYCDECKSTHIYRKKVEKYIWERQSFNRDILALIKVYEIRMKRNCGENIYETYSSLEDARDAVVRLNAENPKEPNTGLSNNACRGGKIAYYHNYYTYSQEFRRTNKEFKCNRCKHTFNISKLNIHHKDHNWYNDTIDNFEILCTYCHREHHNQRDCEGKFISPEGSETIPNGSTLQVDGNGSGSHDE